MDLAFKKTCQFDFHHYSLPALNYCKQGQATWLTCHSSSQHTWTRLRMRPDFCVMAPACGYSPFVKCAPGVVYKSESALIIPNLIGLRKTVKNNYHRSLRSENEFNRFSGYGG